MSFVFILMQQLDKKVNNLFSSNYANICEQKESVYSILFLGYKHFCGEITVVIFYKLAIFN